MTEYVRQELKHIISDKYFRPNGITKVLMIDPHIEQEMMDDVKKTPTGSYMTMDPAKIKVIVKSVGEQKLKIEQYGISECIIMTSPIIRFYFSQMIKDYHPEVMVFSYNEIQDGIEMQSLGMVQ